MSICADGGGQEGAAAAEPTVVSPNPTPRGADGAAPSRLDAGADGAASSRFNRGDAGAASSSLNRSVDGTAPFRWNQRAHGATPSQWSRDVEGAVPSIRIRTLLIALIALPRALSAQPVAAPLAAWVELTPTGPVVRAIAGDAGCPRAAAVAGPGAVPAAWETPMTVRSEPDPPDFPHRVCEWQPLPSVRYVAIEGHSAVLRMLAADPRRIVVIGDTGCWGADDQSCEREWPFADLSRMAAARQPDLVIHLGDYNYRGTNCVAFDGCCGYNPVNCAFPNCGDTWPVWQADFFTPAAPLLAAAPWVMVRGNHELCARAGRGWFHYLDPHTPPPVCAPNPVLEPTYTEPFPLYLGNSLRLLVVDSASACGQPGFRDEVPLYRAQFERLATHVAGGTAEQTWLLTHRPLWGIVEYTAARQLLVSYTLQRASANRLPEPIDLVLAGHEHLFQALTMAGDLPPALLVGTGGAELDDPQRVPERLADIPLADGGPTIAASVTVHDHGYLLMERAGSRWTATFYDRFDQPRATCASDARPSVCTARGP